jgi:acyl-CoA thioester hydrolase
VSFVHEIRVRYQECDMQRVVFNAHYLAYCDETSAAWMHDALGWTGTDDDVDWMVVRAEVDWHGSATYGDTLTVVGEVARYGTTSFALRYRGSVGERPVFTALVTYVSVTPGSATKTPVPDHLKAALGDPVPG